MPKIVDEGGKNADSGSGSNAANSEIDPLDNIPDPSDTDFLDIVEQEERKYYLQKFDELKNVKQARLHCTACDKHLGLLTRHTNRYRMHPLLRSLVCISCQDFYNSGEFEKGEDGSELYCRWCGQGGQVYCCSGCPVVFCEKCIKRNFGVQKINEIESNDDWKCFVCNPKPLWLHRARYWVLILYCNFKNKQAQACTDSAEKVILLRKCQVDEAECCKRTTGRQRNSAPAIIDNKKRLSDVKKILPEVKIQTPEQKKALSINEARQAIKRLGSPVSIKKVTVPPIPIQPVVPPIHPMAMKMGIPPMAMNSMATQFGGPPKRVRMSAPVMVQNLPPPLVARFNPGAVGMVRPEKKQGRRSMPQMNMYNGYVPQQNYSVPVRDLYSNVIVNDSLNLSLDSLTQGLDMQAMPTMSSQDEDDAVVCTPDLPMDEEEEEEEEPVVSSKPDDDVQCLTPTPKIVPKPLSALTEPKPRQYPAVLPSTAFSNIIQMTENDVTINEVTGGLKFKVDPSTLSSSKMYKLPDGRIFAVNNNPNMPGGYSATIVAIDEASLARSGIAQGRSQRLQQRLQRQNKPGPSQPPPKLHSWTTPVVTKKGKATSSPRIVSSTSLAPTKSVIDNNAPAGSVEWFKFNVVDAIDIMNYVLQKLNKIKSSSQELRNKSISDVKEMHTNFDQTLKTSCKRFEEVRETLNSGYKNWMKEKNCMDIMSDDEDEVQILQSEESQVKKLSLPNKPTINDEPIFIDENSNDSTKNNSGEGDGEDASCELLDDAKVEENSAKDDEISLASSKAEMDVPEKLHLSSSKTAVEPEFAEDIVGSENGDKSDEKEKDGEDPLNSSADINKETVVVNEESKVNKETEVNKESKVNEESKVKEKSEVIKEADESSSKQDNDANTDEKVEATEATTPDVNKTLVTGETGKDDEQDGLSNVGKNTSTMDENTSSVDDNTNTGNGDDILSNGKHSPDKNGETDNNAKQISKESDDSMGEDVINKLLYDSEPMELDSGGDEIKKLENSLPSGEVITTDATE